jgi:hypothetical protein
MCVAARSISVPLMTLVLLVAPAAALAQTGGGGQPEQRSTGLPSGIDWTFNLDAGWGTFGFGNSLFTNPKEGVEQDLSDQWFEGYIKPALSGTYTLASSSQLYGKVSVVGERTYGSVPEPFGTDVSSFGPEDGYIGWRSGKSIGSSENLLDLSVGREQYRLGHGFLLFDGAAEGGSRGGYWTNARRAFELAAIGRARPGPHTAEFFYLDKDELDEGDSGTRLWGANYEVAPGRNTTVGVSYLKFFAEPDFRPERDGLNVFNIRAYGAPVNRAPDVTVEFEYASERNGDALDSNAWTLQVAYEFSAVAWTPTVSYRYAFFQGDDPTTSAYESFDPLLPGFYDWGAWWQGEIAGEYFLSNSNLVSDQYRAHFTPSDTLGGGLIFYKFRLDHPESYGPDVTDKDLAFEVDLYVDWKVNSNFAVSLVGAFADPDNAVEQSSGRTKNFGYGMVYLGYSF